jgi:hypothetical protein
VTEILLILLIIVVLFFLPRMVSRSTAPVRQKGPRLLRGKLSGRLRLAILVSAVWLAAAALWLAPWQGNQVLFVWIGAAPVIVGWGIFWVLAGFKQYRH